ncbi:MAG TPA: glutamine amidotransferase [Vicinamibacterales bacterium]
MRFAYSLPWWLAVLLVAGIAAAAFVEYRRPLAPLGRGQRGALVALRVLVLTALVLFLFRPIALLPPAGSRDAIVPILVDTSRSMRIADADGAARLTRAIALLKGSLLPGLAQQFRTEIFTIGDRLDSIEGPALDRLGANARRTDISGALAAIRDRYRGQRVAGVVLLSDGADTGAPAEAQAPLKDGPAVFAVGMGSSEALHDREILGVTAGDPRIDRSSIDLHVSAVSYGFGRTPFPIRILSNGRVLETRRVTPPADGSPVDELYTVAPEPLNATVYTAEIPPLDGEAVTENNARSVLVSPAGRKRRVLVIEGAPGFEHSFMTRTWAGDPSLEVDVVTRKGKNGEGADTFFVQAGSGRGAALTAGFPATREQLFAYDALVIANVEGEYFTRAQLALAAEFVGDRGGGLLVMGGKSFAQRGLSGTPLEEVLPVDLNDRRGGVVKAAASPDLIGSHNKMNVTAEGESHPIMRLGASLEETRDAWAKLPALASSAPLGGPRPGAKILATTTASGGAVLPVVAVQRYGQGRSMVFAGEASWRWKMMVASSDRAYDVFWRQAARWLSADSPDPVAVAVPDTLEPGDLASVEIDARDASFVPVRDARVDATLTLPGGESSALKVRRGDNGRFEAPLAPDRAGLYRVHADARRGSEALGSADRWFYVGGADREFADPRLNEGTLRRIARATGGRYVRASEAAQLATWLQSATPTSAQPERRDLWHQPWAFALVVLLLSLEWTLRRRWGLR